MSSQVGTVVQPDIERYRYLSTASGACAVLPATSMYRMWYERSLALEVEVTRERSSRKVRTCAPTTSFCSEKRTSTYRPKRDELLLRVVLAFPNASRIGLVSRIFSVRVFSE